MESTKADDRKSGRRKTEREVEVGRSIDAHESKNENEKYVKTRRGS